MALNNEQISENQSPLWVIYEQEQNKVSYELQIVRAVLVGLWNSINASYFRFKKKKKFGSSGRVDTVKETRWLR